MLKARVKNNTFVKVIKQRSFYQKDVSYSMNNKDKMYSGIFGDKQCIYSFSNLEIAKCCYQFLKKYKEVNGTYPHLNYGKHYKDISDKESIYIDSENIAFLKHNCLLNGIGLINISHFEYIYIDSALGQKNVFDVNMSATYILHSSECEISEQIINLENLFDFN